MPTVYSKFLYSSDDPDGHIPGLRLQKNGRVKLQPSVRTRNLHNLDNYEDDASYALPKVLSREDLIENYANEKGEGRLSSQLDSARKYVYEEYNLPRYEPLVEHEDSTSTNTNLGFIPLHEMEMMENLDNEIVHIDIKINDIVKDLANAKMEALNFHQEHIEELDNNLVRLEEETFDVQNSRELKKSIKRQREDFAKFKEDNMLEQVYLSLRDRLNQVARHSNHAEKNRMKKLDQLSCYIDELEQHLKTVEAIKEQGSTKYEDKIVQFINTWHTGDKQAPANPTLQYPQVSTQVYMPPNAGQNIIPAYYAQGYQVPCVNQQPIISSCHEGMPEADVENQQRIDIAQCVGDPLTANQREHFHADENLIEDTEPRIQTPEDQDKPTDFDKESLPNTEKPPAVSSEAELQNADDALQVDRDINDGLPDENDEALPSNEEPEIIHSAENDIDDQTDRSGWLGRLFGKGKKSKKSKKKKKATKDKVKNAEMDKKNNKGVGELESVESRKSAEEEGDRKNKNEKKNKKDKKERKSTKDKKDKDKDSLFPNLFSSCFGGKTFKKSKRDYDSDDSDDKLDVEDNVDETGQTTSEEIVNSNAAIINVKRSRAQSGIPTPHEVEASAVVQPPFKATKLPMSTRQVTNKAVKTPAKQAVKLSPKVVALLAELSKPASQPPVEEISTTRHMSYSAAGPALNDSCWDN